MKCPVCNAEIQPKMTDCPSCHLELSQAKRLNDLARMMAADQDLPDEVWEELYTFAEWEKGWQIVEYLGSSPTLYLPRVFKGKPVLHVGDYAFDSLPLLAVHLPKSVQSLGKGAFWHCDLLKLVTFSEGLTSIGEDCFAGCADLKSVSLPDSVFSLGAGCFADCINLSKVKLPTSLDHLPDRAFLGCERLSSISLPKDLVSLGDQSLEGTGLTRLLLPATSLYVGSRALANTPLTAVSIPDETEALGEGAFAECGALTKVKLGKGLKQIGADCFAYTALRSLSVAKGNPVYRVKGGALLSGDVLVVGTKFCTIAREVKIVARHSFVGIEGLTLTIPQGVLADPQWKYDC